MNAPTVAPPSTHGRQPLSASNIPEVGEGVIPKPMCLSHSSELRGQAMNEAPTSHAVDRYVGQRIRELRLIKRMTQSWLGDQVGISFQQLQKYETASNRVSASRLCDIADALDVPASYFFEDLGAGQPRDDVAKNREEYALLTNYRAMPESLRASILSTVESIGEGPVMAKGRGWP